MVKVKDFPQLRALQWPVEYREHLTEEEAYGLYCEHKLRIDHDTLSNDEAILIYRLFEQYGKDEGFV